MAGTYRTCDWCAVALTRHEKGPICTDCRDDCLPANCRFDGDPEDDDHAAG